MKHVARMGANKNTYRVLVGTDQRCEQTNAVPTFNNKFFTNIK